MRRLKAMVKRTPGLNVVALAGIRLLDRVSFRGSGDYWQRRYASGGASGRGSLGFLAEFKARVLNAFVREHGVTSVLELGCGDGSQLALADYPRYVGLDISRSALAACRTRFADDPTKSFFLYDPECFVDRGGHFAADLAISLDVVYHLVEDRVFETYMTHLFGAARRFVIVYSSNADRPSADVHIRHRQFDRWISAQAPAWRLLRHVPNDYPYTGDDRTGSPADFFIYHRSPAAG
jgi:SAM-dependent methyltransferase